MNEHKWEMYVEQGSLKVKLTWEQRVYNTAHVKDFVSEYMLHVEDAVTGEPIGYDVRSGFVKLASAYRRDQVEIVHKMNVLGSDDIKAAVMELFVRSQDGEYLGQATGNENLYVQDVAALLDLDMQFIMPFVDELVEEARVGLYGLILVPNEKYEENFEHWEKTTGHKRLDVGDFGNWYCSVCGKSGFNDGPDEPSPSDVPCV